MSHHAPTAQSGLHPRCRTPWRRLGIWALAGTAALCLAGPARAGFTVFEANAATPAGLSPTRDGFRVAVGGGTTAGANGDFGGLRREINWDGVPDARSDPNALPADFFNTTSPRGVVFSSPTPGASFMVSASVASGQPTLFGFAADLQAFSPQRLFATVGSRSTDIRFFLPGTSTAATTSAFGVVLVDVENDDVNQFTVVEFFDAADGLLFSRHALAGANQGLSFVGAVAAAGERIARVRITTPDNYLLANGSRLNEASDFVVMDDFLYATPVPEPAAWALALLGGLGGFGAQRWRQRRR